MNIVNIKKLQEYTVYIGRPSEFGNPFVIGRDGTREEVCAKFEVYARKNTRLLLAIKALKDTDTLGCYCKPKQCHGDVIIKLWQEIQDTHI